MAITSLKGAIGWLVQSNRLGYRSRDGSRSPDLLNVYPTRGRILAHKALSIGVAPSIDQRQLDPEVGGSLYPVGSMRYGYGVGGDISLQPRLEDYMGWWLYALTGSILAEHVSADGVRETAFYMPFGDDAGKIPWMTIFKYAPGLGKASDSLEIYEDVRALSGVFNIPAAGLVTLDTTLRGRLFGITGEEHFISRSQAVYTTWSAATGGTTTTLVNSGAAWTIDALIGAYVLVRHASGAVEYAEITDNDATSLTFAALADEVLPGDEYIVTGAVVESGVATGGTATTLVNSAATWIDDQFNGDVVYFEDTPDTLAVQSGTVTDTDAVTFTITAAGATWSPVPADGAKYWVYRPGENGLLSLAIDGNIRRVEADHSMYTYAAVNDWVYVAGKGTRRIEMKKTIIDEHGVPHYYLYVDGEFFEEVEEDDIYVVLEQITLDVGGTLRSVVDAELFTEDDNYNGWYLSVYDGDGIAEGPIEILDVDSATTTATLLNDLTQVTDGFAFSIYSPDIDIEWLPYECPFSIPITAERSSYFKGLAEPFGGERLPVRQVTMTVEYTALGSDQEKLIGAYEDDDVTIQSAGINLSFVYRIRNHDLWSMIATGHDVSRFIRQFSSEVFDSDVYLRNASATKIPNTEHPYGIEWYLPHVSWTPGGAPTLSGNDVLELNITGNVEEPCGVKNPIGPELVIEGDSNLLSGSVTCAAMATPVIAAQLDVNESEVEDWLIGKNVRVASGTGEGQVRGIERYFRVDGTNPKSGGSALDTLAVTDYDEDTNTLTVTGISSDDEFNGYVLDIDGKGTVVVSDTVLGTNSIVCSGRFAELPATGDSAEIFTDSGRIIPHRNWITQLLADDSSLVIEDWFAVVVLTNNREEAYSADIPTTP